jgi:hypothetical protein
MTKQERQVVAALVRGIDAYLHPSLYQSEGKRRQWLPIRRRNLQEKLAAVRRLLTRKERSRHA